MITTLLLILILVSVWIGFYQLVKQNGRILLRLDELERNPKPADTPENAHVEAEPAGLPFGTFFPSFTFPDLTGKSMALENLRGAQILLVHWNFDCGFCGAIAPDLARLQSKFAPSNIRLVLLANGDARSNRDQAKKNGLECPILLIENRGVPKPFENQGTPVAYFLDEQGAVAAPFASGADQVLALARSTVSSEDEITQDKHHRAKLAGERSLSESQIERNGLKPGTPAPAFRLPDLQGQTVSLEDFRGKRLLLVFSDPQCGPCDELAPFLEQLYQQHRNNGLALVMVGRGKTNENRRKAKQHGINFPVVVQDKWKLSKEYGIFATPIAFLIGEGGVIARDVAVGKDAILALAHEAATVSMGGMK